jgi:hypothetical protein
MLTMQECLELSELSEDEIHAIAEHEHVPDIVAAELGACLLQSDVGTWLIKRYIREDLALAEAGGHTDKAERLRQVLAQFTAAHPTYELQARS